jgi:hypothetical protein
MEKKKKLLQSRHPDSSRHAGEGFLMTSKWIFLVILALLINLGCSSNKIENLPREVLGHWETETPKYSGFSFELSEETITFTDLNAENAIESNMIEKRTKELDNENNILYVVHYENEEGLELKFSFYYDPSEGGKIRLKNQKTIVWTRVPKSWKSLPAVVPDRRLDGTQTGQEENPSQLDLQGHTQEDGLYPSQPG